MIVNFGKATRRDTPCYYLNVAGVDMVISYETVIAASYGGKCIRRNNDWGPTTGRHMNETGVRDFAVIEDPRTFEQQVNDMIYTAIADSVNWRMAA